jgi:hypothetical protein
MFAMEMQHFERCTILKGAHRVLAACGITGSLVLRLECRNRNPQDSALLCDSRSFLALQITVVLFIPPRSMYWYWPRLGLNVFAAVGVMDGWTGRRLCRSLVEANVINTLIVCHHVALCS